MACAVIGEAPVDTAESENLSMRGNSKRENRETPEASQGSFFDLWERSENASGGTADMHVTGESDGSVVPAKPVNNDDSESSAESAEGRLPANGNTVQAASPRTPSRDKRESRGLHGVREAARNSSTLRFTNLLHHIDERLLFESFDNLKKSAASGVDGVTWAEYEVDLEANIKDLHGRIHRGAYRAKPSRRAWIDKPDGRKRPLGITSLEDKLVQQAVLWVIQCIYEQDFLGFSYGYRPGRSQHQALDALSVALTSRKVSWILDADLESFFDSIDHSWLIKFLEHRIGDSRILRLIRKWLHAGVIEEGVWSSTEVGSPQGSVISPILANVFLHYVFDLWIEWWRHQSNRGDVVVVRYADDIVMGFERQEDAIACLNELRERFAKFGLKLNDAKTRLIEFGRYASERRDRRGERRPETFDFLGFTHQCSKTRKQGWFIVRRISIAKRMRAKLAAIKQELRKRRHEELGETGRWLRRVVQGWMNYHAVPGNIVRLQQFVDGVTALWLRQLRRRSQRSNWTWSRMQSLARRYFPRPRILHPYPNQRFRARLAARAV
jgi:RNA-directed DNA polymerase